MFSDEVIYCIWASTTQRCWAVCVCVWVCMFVPKTRVVRAGYVVDLNVWGVSCVFWQVTLVDGQGGWPVGWVLCSVESGPVSGWRWQRESAVRRGQSYASFSSLELGPHLVPLRKSGGLEVGAGGDRFFVLPRSATHGIATCASLSQSEAILDNLLTHWLTSHCRSHPIPSHGYISSQDAMIL